MCYRCNTTSIKNNKYPDITQWDKEIDVVKGFVYYDKVFGEAMFKKMDQ